MAIRSTAAVLIFAFLTSVVYAGTHQDGAVPALRRDVEQWPFLNDNYTLFRSGGTLQPRQVQGCQSDPTLLLCANSTVCCSQEYPICCVSQQWCCPTANHCCPQQTCCSNEDNCLTKNFCCPKTAKTCGNPDYCLSDDQTCCGSSYCDAGFECVKTPNGTDTCCKSDEQACNGNYCCPKDFTCAGGGICTPPKTSTSSTPSATPSTTPSATQKSTTSTMGGSAPPASSSPGAAGTLIVHGSLSPLLGLLLIVMIPLGLLI